MLQDCDTWSETDSSDSLSQRIYTPTSSTSMNPSSTVSENHEPEHTPLLHGHPTPYEPGGYDEKVPNYVATPDSEVEGIKEPVLPKPVAIPGPSDHSNSCRRRRSRVVAHLVLVKIIPLLGSLGCLAWLFGNFNWVGTY